MTIWPKPTYTERTNALAARDGGVTRPGVAKDHPQQIPDRAARTTKALQ